MNTNVLETRAGIRVLANNEVAAVAGGSVWDAHNYYYYIIGMAHGAGLDWYISDGKMYPKYAR